MDVLTYLCLAFLKVGETGLWAWLYRRLEKLDLLAVLEQDFDWGRTEAGRHVNAAGERMLMTEKVPPASAHCLRARTAHLEVTGTKNSWLVACIDRITL